MKRVFVVVVMAAFMIPMSVSAEFKHSVQSDVQKEIVGFYNLSQGNRLTEYAINGLIIKINQIFRNNIVAPKPESKPDSIPEPVK